MIKRPNREPDMITNIRDYINRVDMQCLVWFSGNEIIIMHDKYDTCSVMSQKSDVWMYRTSWKDKRKPVSSKELIEKLNELAIQKAIEKSIKHAESI